MALLATYFLFVVFELFSGSVDSTISDLSVEELDLKLSRIS